MAQLLSWIATWLVDLWHEPTAISGTMSRFCDGSCYRSAGGRATGEAGSGWRGNAGVCGRGNETVWTIASSRSASSPWSTKVGGMFVGITARCDWRWSRRRRLGEWSALPSAHRRHRTGGLLLVFMVGIRRLNCRRRAARQPSSTRSAPSLAYGGRDGLECGRWERVRHGW